MLSQREAKRLQSAELAKSKMREREIARQEGAISENPKKQDGAHTKRLSYEPASTVIATARIIETRTFDAAEIDVPEHFKRHESEYASPEFDELRASIRETSGNVDPIDVREVIRNGLRAYELMAGSRRVAACAAENKPVLANVREADDSLADLLHDLENAKRAGKVPFSLAMQFSAMMKSGRYATQEQLAARLGRPKSIVSEYVRLIDEAPAGLWGHIDGAHKLTAGNIRLLLKAFSKSEFKTWAGQQGKSGKTSVETLIKKAAEATARQKPTKSVEERVYEAKRGNKYHIALPEGISEDIRAKALALVRKLVAEQKFNN